MGEVLDRGPAPDDFVQSVSRALRVLEVVTARPGLPVKAIARHCGLNLSTTYHLIRTLAYEGYVRRPPTAATTSARAPAASMTSSTRSDARPSRTACWDTSPRCPASPRTSVGSAARASSSPRSSRARARRTSRTSRSVSRSPPTRPRSARRSSPRCRPPNAAATQGAGAAGVHPPHHDRPGHPRRVARHGRRGAAGGRARRVPRGRLVCGRGRAEELPDAPVWAIVVSTRTEEVPPGVGAELMRAARDLAAAPA